MSLSHNEVMGLAAKAARGGGAGPAQAQSFGRAAVCHLGAGRDPDQLTDALGALPGGAINRAALICRTVTQHRETQGTLVLDTDMPEALLASYLDTLPFERQATLRDKATGALFAPDAPSPLPERLEVPGPLLTLMNRLAKLTYVPNSDASRAAGAGAGLSDND